MMTVVRRIGREMLSHSGTTRATTRAAPLRRQTGLPRETVIERMIASFRQRYGLTEGRVSEEELAAAEELAGSKFSSPEWTARVP
ncbi:hypothetical protein [Streptomyces hydrogenans]|uniref:hypothetical protein n=1 Tax=Streptomyces hydrogenans TaxID=1873719 RepID=UPI00364ED506